MITISDIQEIVNEINYKKIVKPTVKNNSFIGEELGIDSLDTQTFWLSLMFLMDKKNMKEVSDEYLEKFDYSATTIEKLLKDINHEN